MCHTLDTFAGCDRYEDDERQVRRTSNSSTWYIYLLPRHCIGKVKWGCWPYWSCVLSCSTVDEPRPKKAFDNARDRKLARSIVQLQRGYRAILVLATSIMINIKSFCRTRPSYYSELSAYNDEVTHTETYWAKRIGRTKSNSHIIFCIRDVTRISMNACRMGLNFLAWW